MASSTTKRMPASAAQAPSRCDATSVHHSGPAVVPHTRYSHNQPCHQAISPCHVDESHKNQLVRDCSFGAPHPLPAGARARAPRWLGRFLVGPPHRGWGEQPSPNARLTKTAGTCRDPGVQLGVPGPGDKWRQLAVGVHQGVPAGPAGGRSPALPPVHSPPEQPLLQRRPLRERRPRRSRERLWVRDIRRALTLPGVLPEFLRRRSRAARPARPASQPAVGRPPRRPRPPADDLWQRRMALLEDRRGDGAALPSVAKWRHAGRADPPGQLPPGDT